MNRHPVDALSDYLDDHLEGGAGLAIDDHLAGCADCRAVVADLDRRCEQPPRPGARLSRRRRRICGRGSRHAWRARARWRRRSPRVHLLPPPRRPSRGIGAAGRWGCRNWPWRPRCWRPLAARPCGHAPHLRRRRPPARCRSSRSPTPVDIGDAQVTPVDFADAQVRRRHRGSRAGAAGTARMARPAHGHRARTQPARHRRRHWRGAPGPGNRPCQCPVERASRRCASAQAGFAAPRGANHRRRLMSMAARNLPLALALVSLLAVVPATFAGPALPASRPHRARRRHPPPSRHPSKRGLAGPTLVIAPHRRHGGCRQGHAARAVEPCR